MTNRRLQSQIEMSPKGHYPAGWQCQQEECQLLVLGNFKQYQSSQETSIMPPGRLPFPLISPGGSGIIQHYTYSSYDLCRSNSNMSKSPPPTKYHGPGNRGWQYDRFSPQ